MKTLIIFLLATAITFSQTREPSQHTFSLNGNPILLNSANDYFKLTNFQLGWHWGGERRISKVMKVNQSDMTTANKNCLLILQDVGHPLINFPV